MAASEPSPALAQVRLGAADVLGGVALSDAAGWNQTADDWQLFAVHGHALGWRTAHSELIASAAALPMGPGIGWLSMVLVAPAWRRQGLARTLTAGCVQHLCDHGITPVLDATPAGEAVYTRLGFRRGFEFARWEGALREPSSPVTGTSQDIDTIARLDADATGLQRGFLLKHLLQRRASLAWLQDDAFVIAREGRRATQVGPLIAAGVQQAIALLQTAFAQLRGRIVIDVPARWTALNEWLMRQGFGIQRSFTRMALAAPLPDGVAAPGDRLFAIAGPEFG